MFPTKKGQKVGCRIGSPDKRSSSPPRRNFWQRLMHFSKKGALLHPFPTNVMQAKREKEVRESHRKAKVCASKKGGRLNLAKDKKVFPHPGPIIHRGRGKYRVYVVKGLPQVLRGTDSLEKGLSRGGGEWGQKSDAFAPKKQKNINQESTKKAKMENLLWRPRYQSFFVIRRKRGWVMLQGDMHIYRHWAARVATESPRGM